MSAITTHILDTARGCPAAGVGVHLAFRGPDGWAVLATGETDVDGRVRDLLPADRPLAIGVYRLRFAVGDDAAVRGQPTFYPYADVVFSVRDPTAHYHVPLLLSPFGYSTYRGS